MPHIRAFLFPTLLSRASFCAWLALFTGWCAIAPDATATSRTPPALEWAVPQTSLHGHRLITTSSRSHATPRLREWDELPNTLLDSTTRYPAHWQAIMVDGPQLAIGCAQGLFRPLQNNTACGQPAGFSEDVLAWDHSRLTATPQWGDLWDVVQVPGQRLLPQSAHITLEVALLADGIEPQKIYDVLSTPQGVERAFHRLDQLRPYIVWWRTPHEAQQLMRHKAFLMGIVPRDALTSLVISAMPYFIAPNADFSFYIARFWSIPNTLGHKTFQKTLTQLQQNPPHFPELPHSLAPNALVINNNFWTAHAPVLEARFTAWLHQQ